MGVMHKNILNKENLPDTHILKEQIGALRMAEDLKRNGISANKPIYNYILSKARESNEVKPENPRKIEIPNTISVSKIIEKMEKNLGYGNSTDINFLCKKRDLETENIKKRSAIFKEEGNIKSEKVNEKKINISNISDIKVIEKEESSIKKKKESTNTEPFHNDTSLEISNGIVDFNLPTEDIEIEDKILHEASINGFIGDISFCDISIDDSLVSDTPTNYSRSQSMISEKSFQEEYSDCFINPEKMENNKYSLINIDTTDNEDQLLWNEHLYKSSNYSTIVNETNVSIHPYSLESDTVKYSDLSPTNKEKLCDYCLKMIERKGGNSGIKKIFKFFKNFVESPEEKPPIHPFILKIIEEIRNRCLDVVGIFRVLGRREVFSTIPFRIQTSKIDDISILDPYDLASVLKAYIRNILNGLIPNCVFNTMKRAIKSETSDLLDYTKLYLPFCVKGSYRRLLLETFKLLIEVDAHSETNKMTMSNLLKIFPPTLFPAEVTPNFEVIEIQSKILRIMLELDYENVPISILKAAMN
ncbi:Rho GTPase-activating protein gacJ [Astathelohania contejeani]|uniref:Rho GTPase-activating protein gacJ n=1 Tax=Astathelohania contejeani TaxID=164912 RepID=A0ABQ7HZC3_9MICR|nr:Rho GTPase-activating protein gacJ [Thelohania contejeani]